MRVRITYFDTAMALIEIGSIRILTDPVLDEAGTVYDDGVIRLEKTGPAAVTVEAIGRIDLVLLSHDQHADNLDTEGRKLLGRAARVLTTPEGAERLGGDVVGLKAWDQVHVSGSDGFTIQVTATPAQHGPDGTEELTGTVTGFLIDWDGRAGSGPIYISGDTVPFAGTKEIAERAAPIGIALLHMGHVSPGPDAGIFLSMSSMEALQYAKTLEAEVIIPLHFDGWKHFSEADASAVNTFESSEFSRQTYWLDRGESVDFDL